MITTAARILRNTKGVSMAASAGFRMVGDVLIDGTANDVTESLQDITVIPNDVISHGEDIETARDVLADYVLENALTVEEQLKLIAVYPKFDIGISYVVGQLVQYNTLLYKVVQAHKSQSDWTPDKVPALFTKVVPATVIPLWVQPTGAHDAYQIGAKVSFNGHIYESKINANVWSPTAYPAGWTMLSVTDN